MSNQSGNGLERGSDDSATPRQEPTAGSSGTVGVGSVLAIGCGVAVVIFVLAAILARTLFGAW